MKIIKIFYAAFFHESFIVFNYKVINLQILDKLSFSFQKIKNYDKVIF